MEDPSELAPLEEDVFNDEYIEGEEGDPEQMIREIGDHPLMERVQEALYRQLVDNHERVTLELREKEEDLKRTKLQRENIGVDLYGVQQQLAKLQMQLESTHQEFGSVAERRTGAEESLWNYQEQFKTFKAEVTELQKQQYKSQAELDALAATLHQVEAYNEEMQGEILVTRRATYKAEENVQNLEKNKKEQDFYIDSLNDQLRRLTEQLALYDAQLVSQRNETTAAVETLADAAREMDSVSFEKKQLLQQWKSALIGLARRDDALQATQQALREQKEARMATEAEIEGYKQSIVRAQEMHETKTGQYERIAGEITFVEDQLTTFNAERAKLAERYAMLQRSMTQTDAEDARAAGQNKALEQQIAQVDANMQIVVQERHKLEADIAANKNTQAMVSKAAKNLSKSTNALQTKIHESEIEYANMQNELSRIRVDALNTESHNMQLKETLAKLVQELKDKDALIEKYELEIRQRNDEIEKKMYRVDRLNRRYEQLTADVEDENTGPLEATIKNLTKEIERCGEANTFLQRQWLQTQTELVNLTLETNKQDEENNEQKSRLAILQQKRTRLLQQSHEHDSRVHQLEKSVANMHVDTSKLNELISNNAQKYQELQNTNFTIEQEFIQELQELEEHSVRLEGNIEEIKGVKADILDEIVEAERQIMLWEKKIQLEKETQAALDPEVGQAEARSMEKEIHRMRLRLEALKRDQSRMVQEMERAIHKREAIAMRHRGKQVPGVGRRDAPTKAELRKRLASLRGTLQHTTTEVSDYEAAIKETLANMEQVGTDLERATSEYGTLEEDAHNMQSRINSALYNRQATQDQITKHQRMAKRFEDLAEGVIMPVRDEDADQVDADLQTANGSLDKVRSIINNLSGEYSHLEEVLGRVLRLADNV